MSLGRTRQPIALVLAASVLAACVALRIVDPEPVARLRLSVFDSFNRMAPRAADPSFPVRIIAIDEAGLASVGQWPWPRTRLAEIVSKLAAAGVASITFDMVLAEADRLSPDELARSLATDLQRGPLLEELKELPANDAVLAKAIARAPVVLGIAGNSSSGRAISAYPGSIAFAGDNPSVFVHAFPGGVETLPLLTQAAHGIGAVNWLPSSDQIVRRIPLLVSIRGILYPSLALEAFRVGTRQSTIFVKSSGASGLTAFGQKTGIETLRVGDTIFPTDGRGELWLKFAPEDARRTISALSVLNGTFNTADLKGRHVIIGATATGLLDLRATPLEAAVPGVEIHAQALEQILSGDHLVRPAYATGAEIAFLVLAGGLVAWLAGRSGALVAAAVGIGAIATIVTLSWLAYRQYGLLLDPIYPSLAIAALYLTVSLTSYLKSEFQRAQIRSAFGHYLAAPLVEELARSGDKLKLGGETREVTLLFADVRGFSKISEGMRAEELIRFVNRLFTPLTEEILKHRGTIDKFMGDAVMAFWNAPVADPAHALNACNAALGMLDALGRLNAELEKDALAAGKPFSPIRIGIGLNTGECVVGNVGSPQRFDYSVLGDVVNVAARFEEATKAYAVSIIVGERTAAEAPQLALLELGAVTPRGKDRPEMVFALLGDEAFANTESFRRWEAAHAGFLIAISEGKADAIERMLGDCLQFCLHGMADYYRETAAKASATA